MLIRAEFDMDGVSVALNIQDTGGSYVDDFPAMVELSLQSADAVILGNAKLMTLNLFVQKALLKS